MCAAPAMIKPSNQARSPRPPYIDPQLLLETMTDSVCLVGPAWSIEYLNDSALAGVQPIHDAVGQRLWDAFPNLIGTDLEKAFRRAMKHRVSTRAEMYDPSTAAWFLAYAHPTPQGLLIYFRDVTAKKRQNLAYRESEERFRKLFESLTQGVVVHDGTGAVVDVNPAAERITGFSLSEMRNLHQNDPGAAVDEDGNALPRHRRPSIVALTTGRPVENFIMGVMHSKLGQRRWLNVHAIPIFQEGATAPHQVFALFADVTARKQAEMALRASEERLSRITQNLPIAVIERVLTRDGKLSYPYYKARGMARPEASDLASGDGAISDVHPEDREAFVAALQSSARDLSLLSQEFRLARKGDSIRWMHSKCVPRRLENGDTIWEGFAIDITEQKMIEEALRVSEAKARRSEAHLARAQRVAGLGSSEYDFRTGEWIWSDELYRIYGLQKGSVQPSREALLELLHPEDRAEYQTCMDRIFNGEQLPPMKVRIIRPDGDIRTIYREIETIDDESGARMGILVTMRDVTELDRIERDHERLKHELLHAQRLDALGRLAGGIAHDINNTLVPVIGLTDSIAKAMPTDSPDAEALSIVRDAGLRAKGLVQQILAFSRRETPNRQPVDLQQFLCDMIGFVRATLPATIVVEPHLDSVPTILADPAQLHQIMINLITNSADAIGATKGKITIFLSFDDSRDRAKISVVDTGCGISGETLEKVFEPFFTTKSVDKGTGLGLSVVYGIVCAHGGEIKVASELGEGTRFDIFLPIRTTATKQGDVTCQ